MSETKSLLRTALNLLIEGRSRQAQRQLQSYLSNRPRDLPRQG